MIDTLIAVVAVLGARRLGRVALVLNHAGFKLSVDRPGRDAQQVRRESLVSTGELQGLGDEPALNLLERRPYAHDELAPVPGLLIPKLCGESLKLDRGAAAEHNRPLDGVLKLSDIARPSVIGERRHRRVADVTVIVKTEAKYLEVEMRDTGASFDPDKVPVPDLAGLPESGMGLFIMRSFVDELSYAPGDPNVLIMRKFF